MLESKKILAVLLSLAVLSSTGLACHGYNSLDLIKADTVSFQNTPGTGPETCYTVPIDMDLPNGVFQTAISISAFNGFRPQHGFDYSVRGAQKSGTKILSISLLIDELTSWTKMTVSYLVTARNDIFAGTFLTDTFSQSDCAVTGNQELAFSANVLNVPNGDYEVKVFIAGIEVKDNDFDFAFKRAVFNARTGVLDIKATTNAYPHIENIHVSFVIYRTSNAFVINVIPSAFVRAEDYVFLHTASFGKDGPEVLALTFDSDRLRCTGRGCLDKCINIPRCTAAGGIVNGKDCVICGKWERLENKQCVPACRDNEDYDSASGNCNCKPGFSKNFENDICKWTCGVNEIWNRGCVCKDNHVRIGDSCIPCPAYGRIIDGKIVCDRDYYWHPRKYTCDHVAVCRNNESPQYDEKTGVWGCGCNKDCYRHPSTQVCQYVAPCPPYSTLKFEQNMWKCVCDRDYLWNDKRYSCDAFSCQANASPVWSDNGWTCVCNTNYYWNVDRKICQYVAPCPAYSTLKLVDNMWKCVCDRDYLWNEKRYSCDTFSCQANASPVWTENGWTCACNSNYYLSPDRKTCQYVAPCPAYSSVKLVDNMWKCVCDRDYFWNDQKYTCDAFTCQANASPVWSNNGWNCVCNANYYLNADKKTCDYLAACIPNSRPVWTKNNRWECVCDPDYYFNSRKSVCDYVPDCSGPNTDIVFGPSDKLVCGCKPDCYLSGKICKPYQTCPAGSRFNPSTERCECTRQGEYLYNGACRSCGKYEEWDQVNKRMYCRNGYNYKGERCVQICTDYEDQLDDGCICKPSCYLYDRKCTPCPVNSRPNADRSACICVDGYTSDGAGRCVEVIKKCPEGMERTPNGNCVCKDGFYMEAGICKLTPKCPIKSRWNQEKLRCECTVAGEYMINNVCTACKANEGWNGKECACTTGFFKVDGACITCDPNSYYTGKDCACNIGFYGSGRSKCNKCHSSCGKCTGPKEDECLMCSDVSYTFVKKSASCGICTRNAPCPVGLYSERNECKPCSSYCASCVSESVCKTCIEGFEINEMEYDNVKYSYCVEICGDGRRFELDCDDGNKKNGDGCNDNCEVETGFHCQGGSSIKASTCVNYKPSRSYVTLTGSVHAFGKIVQGVRLSYIPPELTANDCMNCHKLLWVRVISSAVVPGVRVNYLPKSQYQFLTEFDFNGLFAIPVFTISIQINPEFAQYFAEADLAQIEVKSIDPATLAKHDTEETLSEDDIDPTKIKVSDSDLKNLFPEPKK